MPNSEFERTSPLAYRLPVALSRLRVAAEGAEGHKSRSGVSATIRNPRRRWIYRETLTWCIAVPVLGSSPCGTYPATLGTAAVAKARGMVYHGVQIELGAAGRNDRVDREISSGSRLRAVAHSATVSDPLPLIIALTDLLELWEQIYYQVRQFLHVLGSIANYMQYPPPSYARSCSSTIQQTLTTSPSVYIWRHRRPRAITGENLCPNFVFHGHQRTSHAVSPRPLVTNHQPYFTISQNYRSSLDPAEDPKPTIPLRQVRSRALASRVSY